LNIADKGYLFLRYPPTTANVIQTTRDPTMTMQWIFQLVTRIGFVIRPRLCLAADHRRWTAQHRLTAMHPLRSFYEQLTIEEHGQGIVRDTSWEL
jgi:hypothetical protein